MCFSLFIGCLKAIFSVTIEAHVLIGGNDMHEFIIEIVKSDEIYRKIANASLEKKDDIYRYDFMKKFEKKWDMYHCPLKAKQSGGYDVVMASGMLGYLLPQKIGDTEQKYIAELADEKLSYDIC